KCFKMDNNKYLEDLHEIRSIMSRSTQFISLSGLSGVLAGVYALIGAYIAKRLLTGYDRGYGGVVSSQLFIDLVVTAITVLVLAVLTAFVLTYFKARRDGEEIWNGTAKRMSVNFLIPLATGGVFALILLRHELYGYIAPVTMIFYGLACV